MDTGLDSQQPSRAVAVSQENEAATTPQESEPNWHVKKLSPKHRQICSLLAQGSPRDTIAGVCGVTPEYISMLAKQPLVQQYVREMSAVANLQLEAMFTRSVQAIGEVLECGNASDKVKAARLQMEATKRVGSGAGVLADVVDSNTRLTKLAERLLYLQGNSARVVNGSCTILENENGAGADTNKAE